MADTYRSGKNARAFVTKSSTAVEIPIISFSVDPGAARRIEFVHSRSQGGTDIAPGVKSAATFQLNLELDFDNDPFDTGTGKLGLIGGAEFAKVELYPYGGTASTPSGIKHLFANALIEGSPLEVMIDGKPAVRISGACSTRNYSYDDGTP